MFDENTVITITGDDGEIGIIEPLLSEDGTVYRIWTEAMLSDDGSVVMIDKVEVNIDLDIKAGESTEDHLTCTVPEDARYSAAVLYWVDVTGEKYELVMEGEFIEGHKYEVFIAFAAHEGCVFTDDVKVLLNGSEDHDSDVFTVTGSNILIASNDITAKPAVTIGDVNGDGKVNTADAVIVLKYSAEMITLDEKQLVAGDCNFDGKVNTADAVLILKYAAEMIAEF